MIHGRIFITKTLLSGTLVEKPSVAPRLLSQLLSEGVADLMGSRQTLPGDMEAATWRLQFRGCRYESRMSVPVKLQSEVR